MIDFGDNFSWADKQLHFETELSNASSLFTAGGFADFVKKDEALEERKGALEKLSELATEDRKKFVQELVTLIFPPISRIRDQPHDRWLKARRVCHSAIFDRYFSYRLGDQDISQSDLDQSVILADTREFVLRFFEEQWRQPSIAGMAYNLCRRSPTSLPLFASGSSATTFSQVRKRKPVCF